MGIASSPSNGVMTISLFQLLLCLGAGVSIIILLTVRYRVHAFFALMLASLAVGLGVGLPVPDILAAMKDGFGNVMKSLGFIIVLGTALGILLGATGSTRVMAAFILRKVGERHSALAISITGFIVGLPIFCDSGYIVLSGLNKSLARRTGISLAAMAVSLAAGLYSVHCLIPPHPGATAAASVVGVDFGKLILLGIVVAIPATVAGYAWANFTGRRISVTVAEEEILADAEKLAKELPQPAAQGNGVTSPPAQPAQQVGNPAQSPKLTVEDIKKMTPAQVNERWEEVSRVLGGS